MERNTISGRSFLMESLKVWNTFTIGVQVPLFNKTRSRTFSGGVLDKHFGEYTRGEVLFGKVSS